MLTGQNPPLEPRGTKGRGLVNGSNVLCPRLGIEDWGYLGVSGQVWDP